MRDMYAQRKDVCARRGQYTALPSWTALCPHRRYRPTHIAVGTNLNSPAHMDASRETIGAAGGASTLPLAGERTGLHVQGRVTVQLTLPVVGERTTRRVQGRVAVQSVRSRPSGSEGMGSEHARGRVAVHLTLPLAGERTGLHVQGRVAVRTERSRSLTVQVGTTFGPVGITSASGNSPSGAYPEPSPETTPRTRGNLFADRMVSRLVKPICFASPSGAKVGRRAVT